MVLAATDPMAVSLDPLRPSGERRRRREVEEGNPLPVPTAPADRQNVIVGEVDSFDCGRYSEDLGLERNLQSVLNHREQAADLLALVVAIDRCLLEEIVQSLPAETRAVIRDSIYSDWSRRRVAGMRHKRHGI
jgi:hypothetical protein